MNWHITISSLRTPFLYTFNSIFPLSFPLWRWIFKFSPLCLLADGKIVNRKKLGNLPIVFVFISVSNSQWDLLVIIVIGVLAHLQILCLSFGRTTVWLAFNPPKRLLRYLGIKFVDLRFFNLNIKFIDYAINIF